MAAQKGAAKPECFSYDILIRGHGEIGIRNGFKIRRPLGLAGSSPAVRTILYLIFITGSQVSGAKTGAICLLIQTAPRSDQIQRKSSVYGKRGS